MSATDAAIGRGGASRRRGLALGPVGVVVRPRACLAAVLVAAGCLAVLAIGLVVGDVDVPLPRIWAALSGRGDRIEELVVLDRRFGRAMSALMIGFCLGCAGALTQSVTRNPIATPDILGVMAGAAAAASFLLTQPVLAGDLTGGPAERMLVPAALAGGFLTTLLIVGLSFRRGDPVAGFRLILTGIAVNALAASATTYFLARADSQSAAVATRWLVGSLDGARYDDLAVLLPTTLVAVVGCLLLGRSVADLRLGVDTAASLGTSPGRTSAWSLLLAVVLSATCTAVAGPIALVAFVAPHAARRFFGSAGPPLLAGGLVGALLLAGADLVADRLPVPLPVGIVTACLGAPVLMVLVISSTRRASA